MATTYVTFRHVFGALFVSFWSDKYHTLTGSLPYFWRYFKNI